MVLDWKLTYQLTHVSVQKSKLSEMSIRDLPRLECTGTYRYIPVHTILPDPVQVYRIPDVRADPGLSASCLLLLIHVRGTAFHVPVSAQRGAVTGPGEDVTFQVARPHSAGRPSD